LINGEENCKGEKGGVDKLEKAQERGELRERTR
jgi:hypothetical protein